MILEVVDGGLQTTIQDAGRPDWTHLGVPRSGAADGWSLALANLLVGNPTGAAAVEIAVLGPRLVVREAGTIGLAGAELGARVDGRPLAVGRSQWLDTGAELTFDGAPPDAAGIRAYLALAGGVDVPVVLGSRSTCLAGGFAGFEGRPLRAGDRLRSGPPGVTSSPRGQPGIAVPLAPDPTAADRDRGGGRRSPVAVLRVVAAPSAGLDALVAESWSVSAAADRVGIRLVGPPLPAGLGGEALTSGVPWGAVQVPPNGEPIILSVDHQTTGGYRVVAVVIAADLPLLGQLGPGMAVRLVAVGLEEADAAARERRTAMDAVAAAIRDATGWEDLVSSAGG